MTDTTPAQVRTLLARHQLLNQQEHKRLARRIHDEVSQKMTLLALQLSLAAAKGEAPPDWEKNCKDWANLVMELGQTIREISVELQPRIQDKSGLAAAFRWFAQTSAKAIRCTILEPTVDISLPPFVANELFAISREIVSDILVPAGVGRVEIQLEQEDGAVRLHLRANDTALKSESITEAALTAIAMHERLLCLDGTADLRYSADTGSVLILTVPTGSLAACAAK